MSRDKKTTNWFKAFLQHPEFTFWGAVVLWAILVLMFIAFVGVMAFKCVYEMVSCWLGTGEDKTETLKFIGLGMGGVLAAIGAITINRRAKALEQSNELVRQSRINNQFIDAIKNLWSDDILARRSSFYQFYYLAKEDQEKVFTWDIFDALCFRLCETGELLKPKKEDAENSCPKHNTNIPDYLQERDTLFNILFKKYSDEYLFDKYIAELSGAYLEGSDLRKANLINADLKYACISGTNLSGANLAGADLSYANFSGTKDWNKKYWIKNTLYHTSKGFDNVKKMGANLSDVNLADAYLSGANLSKTNLSGANLSGADFSGTEHWNKEHWRKEISDSEYEESDNGRTMGACLSGANLSNAILQKAQLENVDFKNVLSIEKADFRGAKIGDRPITADDLPKNKGEYYADWNPPPQKKES